MFDISNMQDEELVVWLVVWTPLTLDPSDGVFGSFRSSSPFAAAAPYFFVCLFVSLA